MTHIHDSRLWALLEAIVGAARTGAIFAALDVHPDLRREPDGPVSRGVLAQAMNMLLFEDLLRRVPIGEAYVQEGIWRGRRVVFDHGALRTVAAFTGGLPSGEAAFTRLLRPLGFERAGVYPLDRLSMTGRAYAHRDHPFHIAQFFVSELHPERFSPEFQAAALRVVSTSRDPLPASAQDLLEVLAAEGELPFDLACRLLPNLVACFARAHAAPSLRDYEVLLAESREMAWIATEGNAFNHATDRVDDVAGVAEEQRRLGRPMKRHLEVSAEGTVIQTAYRAVTVERAFVDAGRLVLRAVPGSFFELITRKAASDGKMDLSFDTGNAQGIFKMTAMA